MTATPPPVDDAAPKPLPWRLAGQVALVFGISRLLVFALGVRFDAAPLGYYVQYADPALLQHDLWRTLAVLHSQPPLFNLFLGLVLQAAGPAAPVVFWACFLVCGLLLTEVIALALAALGLDHRRVLLLTALWCAYPPAIVYEHWLFYTLPVTAALTGLVWSLYLLARDGRRRHTVAVGLLLVVVPLTRSLFHLAWLLGVAGLACWQLHDRRRRLVPAVAVAVLVVGGWYTKNLVWFGTFGASSWAPFSLAKLTTAQLAPPVRAAARQSGALSPLAEVPPLAPPTWYPAELRATPPTGWPGLDQVSKSTGDFNLNHAVYLRLAPIYAADARWVIRHQPTCYLRAVGRAWASFFASGADYPLTRGNLQRLGPLGETGRLIPLVAPLVYLVLLPALAWAAWRRPADTPAARAERLLLLTVAFNVAWVALVGNALELGENFRFRFNGDPSALLALGCWWQRLTAPKH